MPVQILTKFGDDWTKASKVIELTRPILGNFFNKRAITLDSLKRYG